MVSLCHPWTGPGTSGLIHNSATISMSKWKPVIQSKSLESSWFKVASIFLKKPTTNRPRPPPSVTADGRDGRDLLYKILKCHHWIGVKYIILEKFLFRIMSNQFAFTGRPGSRGGAGAYYNTGPDVTDVKQPNAGLSRTTTSSGCYTVVSR